MILDSEKQRETLINCIDSCQLTGMFLQLIPVMQEISEALQAVRNAEVVSETEMIPHAVKD